LFCLAILRFVRNSLLLRRTVLILSFSEDAVEHDELATFLRLNEHWDPDIDGDGKAAKPVAPVGVPGAASPSQMRPDIKPSFAPQPSPLARRVVSNRRQPDEPDEIDAGDELGDHSLVGVKVTEDELLQLVSDLGLGGAEAEDLIKGLSGSDTKPKAGPESEGTAAVEKPGEETEKPAAKGEVQRDTESTTAKPTEAPKPVGSVDAPES
jgi:hypothetical protein